jgi:hypothetical protein
MAWDELEHGEVLLEQGRAGFYSHARGDLALTDRRLLFRAAWQGGELGLTVPLGEIERCVEGRRLRWLGRGRQIVVGLRRSPFVLRFQFTHDPAASSVFARAVQDASSNAATDEIGWTSPLQVEIGAGVAEQVKTDGGRPIHVWCQPALGGLGFLVKADLKQPKGRAFAPSPLPACPTLMLSPELFYFNRLRVTAELGRYWAATPASDD